MTKVPERIYLQTWADPVTWCEDRIDGTPLDREEEDVEYVRADLYEVRNDMLAVASEKGLEQQRRIAALEQDNADMEAALTLVMLDRQIGHLADETQRAVAKVTRKKLASLAAPADREGIDD
jgi:hypothetical protein